MNRTHRWFIALTILGLIVAATFLFLKKNQVSSAPITARQQSAPSTLPGKSAGPHFNDEPSKATSLASASNNKVKGFAELNVLERNTLLAEIAKLEHSEIFRLWLVASRTERDLMKQSAIGTKLGVAMRQRTPSAEFLRQIRVFISDASNAVEERRGAIGVLGFSSTKESIELLLELALTLPDENLRHSAISGIRGTGQMLEAQHGERLVPLVKAWNTSSDPRLLQAVGVAMAEIGAPEGIALLLKSASLADGGDEMHGRVAKIALGKVYADQAAVPVIEFLSREPASSPASALAGKILVNIGSAEAGKALLGWLQNAEDGAASEAYEFVVSTRSPALLKVWSSSSDQSVPFRSEKVRQAIQGGLSDYHQARTLKSP